MKRPLIVVFVVLVAGGIVYYFAGTGGEPSRDPGKSVAPERPAYQLKVLDVTGEPRGRFPGDTTWTRLSEGQVLVEGTEVRAREDSSLSMVVPERAYFQFEHGSMEVSDVETDRDLDQSGDTTQVVEQNQLELESDSGTLRSSVRNDTSLKNEYRLKTPSAVLGIRGTTYGCRTARARGTSCGVLEGEVTFANRADTSRSVRLESGQSSSISSGETEPSDPDSMSQDRRRELESVRSTARDQLGERPFVASVRLGDTPLTRRTNVIYRTEDEFLLNGRADSRGIAPLEDVVVTVNGKTVPTDGTARWSAELEPDPPELGSRRRLRVTVQAVTRNGLSSLNSYYLIDLRNPYKIPPPGYRQTSMRFELVRIDSLQRKDFSMPFTLYTEGDGAERLTLSGRVEAPEGTVRGLAYRLEDDDRWKRMETDGDWTLQVTPPEDGRWSLSLMAWTDGRTHSPIESLGPFRSVDRSAETAISQSFESFWDAFTTRSWNDVLTELSERFQFEHPTEGEIDAGAFRKILEAYGKNLHDPSVNAHVRSIEAEPSEGILRARLEMGGTLDDSYEGVLGLPPIQNGYGSLGEFRYRRDSDGKYRLVRLTGRQRVEPERPSSPEKTIPLETGASTTLELNHRTGVDLKDFTALDNSSSPAARRQEGHVIVGVDEGPFEWNGEPPTLYVNDGSHKFCTGYYCYDYPVRAGGIRRAESNSLGTIESFPGLVDGSFEKDAVLEPGAVYYIHVRTSEDATRRALLKVVGPVDGSGPIRARLVEVK